MPLLPGKRTNSYARRTSLPPWNFSGSCPHLPHSLSSCPATGFGLVQGTCRQWKHAAWGMVVASDSNKIPVVLSATVTLHGRATRLSQMLTSPRRTTRHGQRTRLVASVTLYLLALLASDLCSSLPPVSATGGSCPTSPLALPAVGLSLPLRRSLPSAPKVVHIYAHLTALGTAQVLLWGISVLCPRDRTSSAAAAAVGRATILNKTMAPNRRYNRRHHHNKFHLHPGGRQYLILCSGRLGGSLAQHWLRRRQIFPQGAALGSLLGILVRAAMIAVSWAVQGTCYALGGIARDIVMWPLARLASAIRRRLPQSANYAHIQQHDDESTIHHEFKDDFDPDDSDRLPNSRWTKILYMLFSVILLLQVCYPLRGLQRTP